MFIYKHICLRLLPILKHAALTSNPPFVENGYFGGRQDLVLWVLAPRLLPASLLCVVRPVPRYPSRIFTSRTSCFPNQRLTCRIRGGNNTLGGFLTGHEQGNKIIYPQKCTMLACFLVSPKNKHEYQPITSFCKWGGGVIVDSCLFFSAYEL